MIRARRLLGAAGLALVPALAWPQTGPPSGPRPGFLTGYDFHLNAAAFLADDERFNWDADFGGALDVVDYGLGRARFLANFEAILGEEFRRFDPVQGNYTLEGSVSWRLPVGEVAGVFHHVSRHLSDRAKDFPIDWNMAGVEYRHDGVSGRLNLESRVRMLWTTTRSFVDYERSFGAAIDGRYDLGPRVGAIGSLGLAVLGVDRRVFGRGTQVGARLEGGVRVRGERGAVDLFAAVERRPDAEPIQHRARTWALVGFRLLGP